MFGCIPILRCSNIRLLFKTPSNLTSDVFFLKTVIAKHIVNQMCCFYETGEALTSFQISQSIISSKGLLFTIVLKCDENKTHRLLHLGNSLYKQIFLYISEHI